MSRLLKPGPDGERWKLASPVAMPRAAAFLWNRRMMMQVNCRGYVVARHMQPEPGMYSYAPNIEARTFMQAEQPYYAHHPGRFVYIKDEDNDALFSAPYEPVRKLADDFEFSAGKSDIRWTLRDLGLEVTLKVSLPADDAVELWSLCIRNRSGRNRKLSIYPFFTIGYMSWMNQSACYHADLGGIVATCVTPYQKVEDCEAIAALKDKTFFLHDTAPLAWESAREIFEGEGGLHDPDAIRGEQLANGDAIHETPAGVFQYRIELAAGGEQEFRFIFGPARDDNEIRKLREKYLCAGGFEAAHLIYRDYLGRGQGCLTITTPDKFLDNFVNHWLNRQVYYHGDVNRLATDPQTRNFLQDNMGMAYLIPEASRRAFLTALGQQEADGAMPDGILLHQDAELKYINQVPHTDHCCWLPVCLQAYLDETGDYELLDQVVASSRDGSKATVFERIESAMRWLIGNRDERGLSYIGQGDWCDPMNMVGHKGRGVSGWLSMATVYALRLWAELSRKVGQAETAREMLECAAEIDRAVQKHLWNGDWFARGITDDGAVFGTEGDGEGRIFLNSQSWAILADIATDKQRGRIFTSVEQQLETPYGVEMLAPSFTRMRDDIGRVTQKHPGSAENGSVYNHAAIFYIYALYTLGESERAFSLLRRMIPGQSDEDCLQRGQLPVFVPTYYRGAWRQFPRTAGRSSQLFNTGTASWLYRTLIDGLFGVKGCERGLRIDPRLPSHWPEARIERRFRGALFNIRFRRDQSAQKILITVDGKAIDGQVIETVEAGTTCEVMVVLPAGSP